jgi:hypothetical protein
MTDEEFTTAKQKLDVAIDYLGYNPQVGILMGIEFYTEFRRRGLLKDAVADFVHWKFTMQGYRDLFVAESDSVTDVSFRICNAQGT